MGLSIVLLLAVALQVRVHGLSLDQIVKRTDNGVQYVPQLENVLIEMMDSDNSGDVRISEAEAFLATPGVPAEYRTAFAPAAAVDTNRNGLIDRYEIESTLVEMLRKSDHPGLAITNLIVFEIKTVIRNGQLHAPQTPEEVADAMLGILDTDGSGTISRDEAFTYFQVVATDRFWEIARTTSQLVDQDGDQELDRDELVAWYRLMEVKVGRMTPLPLLVYGRVMEVFGEVPR